jgi:pimeloyl-ACP methyl ester carboxylesterase
MNHSRRTALRLLAAAPLLRAQTPAVKPFRVAVPKQTLDRILRQVRQTRWPEPVGDVNSWQYGVSYQYLRDLAAYWTSRFDWRKAEAKLNGFPQFLARVDDFEIHFYHVRGHGPRPVPLVITHGWPGSVVEFLDAIGPLTDPVAHGHSADDAFDLVIPSLPGFGYSSKPKGKPVGPPTTARLWHKLMTEVLGYQRFGAQGGDWGNAVTTQLAIQFPQSMIGIHLNAAGARPVPENQLTPEEAAWVRTAAAYRQNELDYFNEQQHKPQTVAFALFDHPLGTAAWIVEKLKVWSDSSDALDQTLTKDQVLMDVMWYLVTDTAGSAVWFYRGNADDPAGARPARIMTPTGFAAFPKEMTALEPPRSLLERDFNLVHYTKMPRGGHFACFEQPKLFVDDVRDFFRALRT